ncbi:MAG: hypothetical protein AAF438_22160, partial [Pseudomonadota bacterium]
HLQNSRVKLVLDREIDSILHVGHNDQRAHRGSQIVVRINSTLIFDKILGLVQFPDVVGLVYSVQAGKSA